MATYVPGTLETDTKKIVMSLQQIGPKLDNMQAVWTAYTPPILAGSGTFTSASASGRYLHIGKTVHITIQVNIITNGTAASYVAVQLPFPAFSTGNYVINGREALNGKTLAGMINGGASSAVVVNYDNSYPGGDGFTLVLTGVYESA